MCFAGKMTMTKKRRRRKKRKNEMTYERYAGGEPLFPFALFLFRFSLIQNRHVHSTPPDIRLAFGDDRYRNGLDKRLWCRRIALTLSINFLVDAFNAGVSDQHVNVVVAPLQSRVDLSKPRIPVNSRVHLVNYKTIPEPRCDGNNAHGASNSNARFAH